MTQQQIGYMNAQTSRERLKYEKTQAEAAQRQAEIAARKQQHYEDTEFWWSVGTGAAATIGGLLLLAFL